MAVIIQRNHPLFLTQAELQARCQAFLQAHGLNYFQYLRCYRDGSISLLVNNTGLTEYFQEIADKRPLVYSSYTQEQAQLPSYWFLWDETLPDFPVRLARERFSIYHGLTLVKRFAQYYDMIAVALPQPQANPALFYLNKLKAIEQFIQHFQQTNPELMTILDQHPIALPKAHRDQHYQQLCLAKQRLQVQGKTGNTYLTTQEFHCLQWYLAGFSYKEIARQLQISPRSVETYLARSKQRTGYSSTTQLQHMLLTSQLLTDQVLAK